MAIVDEEPKLTRFQYELVYLWNNQVGGLSSKLSVMHVAWSTKNEVSLISKGEGFIDISICFFGYFYTVNLSHLIITMLNINNCYVYINYNLF